MNTKSQQNKARATKLIEAIAARKTAKKLEDAIKEEFRTIMGDSVSLTVEGVAVITLEEKARSFLDQKLIAAEHGQEFIDSYKGITEYQQFNILAL